MTKIPDWNALEEKGRALVGLAIARRMMVATAESCTGGLVAALLTEIPGSSAVLERGFVTYSNAAKADCLGIDPALIEKHGAVSEPVARAMAAGALSHARAHVSIAVTGIAGPGGGSVEKPVGLVHFASATTRGIVHRRKEFGDLGRAPIRLLSAATALDLLMSAIENASDQAVAGP